MEQYFYLKELTDKTPVLQSWAFGRHFLQNEHSEPVSARKTVSELVANDKLQALHLELEFEFWKICPTLCLMAFPLLQDSPSEISGAVTKCHS